MRLRSFLLAVLLLAGVSSALLAYQRRSFGRRRGFSTYGQEDGENILPTNTNQKAEWVFARFHYDSGSRFRRFNRRWAADYPKSDRQFVEGVKRLTRIDTRTVEQVVDANSDDIYNWPWIFVEDAGAWRLSQAQAARLRSYLLRGGFLMLDDTHGDYEWENLVDGMRMVFPDRRIEELPDKDEIFHVLYDLDGRFQIPGTRYIWGGRRYTPDSRVPKWLGIRDDQGRVMVAICHNSDVGDAWEWADSPDYPERATSMAYRIGINYVVYAMTH